MKMTWLKHIAIVSLIASTTSGCIMYRLETLRHTTPSGTPFQNELSHLYMDFAAQGEKEYDWFNSWHFADKGLMLAYGKDMGPEDLKDWDIPDNVLPEMERARASLVSVLTPGLEEASPSRAADAQFYFDCWVKYQEANWQTNEIAYCRDNFFRVLDDLTVPGMKPSTHVIAKKPASKSKHKSLGNHVSVLTESQSAIKSSLKKETLRKEPAPDTISFAVFFEKNKAVISEPGKNVINEVIASLKNVSNYEVNLHISANRASNSALSEERVQAVKKRLVDGGVSEGAIKASDSPNAHASDSQPNRRVEIFLNE